MTKSQAHFITGILLFILADVEQMIHHPTWLCAGFGLLGIFQCIMALAQKD